jgi:putative tryptophan/tyrosine transport system substrate-binding protein
MKRWEFIAGLGSAAAWSLATRAQLGESVRRVGILQVGSRIGIGHLHVEAFKSALAELGWIEDRIVRHEERWADDSPELLPILAMELVKVGPDVIFLTDSPCLRPMRRATSDIPIVFAAVADPVGQGFVSSLARPGGNITGFALGEFSLVTKALDFLKKLGSVTVAEANSVARLVLKNQFDDSRASTLAGVPGSSLLQSPWPP